GLQLIAPGRPGPVAIAWGRLLSRKIQNRMVVAPVVKIGDHAARRCKRCFEQTVLRRRPPDRHESPNDDSAIEKVRLVFAVIRRRRMLERKSLKRLVPRMAAKKSGR